MRRPRRPQRLREKHKNPVALLWAYGIPRLFRPLSEMKRLYPILEKAPILLPVFWVRRVLSMMLLNQHAFWRKIRLIFQEGGKHG